MPFFSALTRASLQSTDLVDSHFTIKMANISKKKVKYAVFGLYSLLPAKHLHISSMYMAHCRL